MRCTGMRKTHVVLAAVLAFALVGPACADEEKEFRLPPRQENAAVNYLLAIVLFERPDSEEEIEAIELIESELYRLPPEALAGYPEATDILEGALAPSGGAIWALHEGAQKPTCTFDVDWAAGPNALLPHLAQMRNLARRCLAAAKCAEFQGDYSRAAQIYGDLMRMGAHLGEEPLIISGLVGVAVQSMTMSEIEGFLARAADENVLEELLKALQSVPARPFACDIYFRAEAEGYGEWLRADPIERTREIVNMGVGQNMDEVAQHLTTKKADEVRAWIREYQEIMRRVAGVIGEPYYKSASKVKAEKKHVEEVIAHFGKEPTKGNPLIGLLIPALWRCREVFATAEARLGMIQLLCAAQLHKAKSGEYPAALDDLKAYFPQAKRPMDPFTGEDFLYTLTDGLPRIESRPPKEMKKKEPGKHCFDLAQRQVKDEQALASILEEHETED